MRAAVDTCAQHTGVINEEYSPCIAEVLGPVHACQNHSVELDLAYDVFPSFGPLVNQLSRNMASEGEFKASGRHKENPTNSRNKAVL